VPLSITQLKSGVTVAINNNVFIIQEYQHVKPGKGAAFVRVKLKNLLTGAVFDKTFKPDDKLQEAFIEEKKLLFQYRSGDFFYFMNQENYEEITISEEQIKNKVKLLKDNLEVNALFFKGKLLKVVLPNFITLKVIQTEPGFRGNTAKASTKPAKLETGLNIQVPLFINTSDTIKIDTRTGAYVERT